MKTTMAVAAFVMFTASAFGQAVQRPQPAQTPQQHIILTSHAPVKAMQIPNWPADKPAPIIQIPTEIQSQPGLVIGVPRFVPSKPARPCAIYNRNCQLLELAPPNTAKPQKRITTKVVDKLNPGS